MLKKLFSAILRVHKTIRYNLTKLLLMKLFKGFILLTLQNTFQRYIFKHHFKFIPSKFTRDKSDSAVAVEGKGQAKSPASYSKLGNRRE